MINIKNFRTGTERLRMYCGVKEKDYQPCHPGPLPTPHFPSLCKEDNTFSWFSHLQTFHRRSYMSTGHVTITCKVLENRFSHGHSCGGQTKFRTSTRVAWVQNPMALTHSPLPFWKSYTVSWSFESLCFLLDITRRRQDLSQCLYDVFEIAFLHILPWQQGNELTKMPVTWLQLCLLLPDSPIVSGVPKHFLIFVVPLHSIRRIKKEISHVLIPSLYFWDRFTRSQVLRVQC